ncbi:MAG: glycoside hydrolase family 16 protein [Bacteroidota bacterium]
MTILNLHKTRLMALVLLPCLALSLNSCEIDPTQQLEERSWTLTWSDEFEGEAGSSINTDIWNYDLGRGDNGWGNEELQIYTNDTVENVFLDGEGNLVIRATSEDAGSFSIYRSARITTKGNFSQAYGRFEARLKTPFGPGLWPAFWMLGDNIDEVGWPQCGEIDVMELRGQQPNIALGSLHGPGYSAGNAITGSFSMVDGRFDTEFHLYAVEWFEDRIDFFIDDFLYQRITREDIPDDAEWVYDQPFYLLLNVAVGGTFVGFPSSQTPFPQTMTVDYVRVYE